MLRPWLDIVRTKTADHGELWSFTTDPDGKYLKVRGLDDIRTFDHVALNNAAAVVHTGETSENEPVCVSKKKSGYCTFRSTSKFDDGARGYRMTPF